MNQTPSPAPDIISRCQPIYQRITLGDFAYRRDLALLMNLQIQTPADDHPTLGLVALSLGALSVYAGYLSDALTYFETALAAFTTSQDYGNVIVVRAYFAEVYRYLQNWNNALDHVRLAQELQLAQFPHDISGVLFGLKVNAARLHLNLRHDDLAALMLRSALRQHIENPTQLHHIGQLQAHRMLLWMAMLEQDYPKAADHLQAALVLSNIIGRALYQLAWAISAHCLALLSPASVPQDAAVYANNVWDAISKLPPSQALLTLANAAQETLAIGQFYLARWLINIGLIDMHANATPDLLLIFTELNTRIN